MTTLKTIDDVMLPMRVLNWIVGCGGIIEFPLNNPHRIMSLLYSSACGISNCLLLFLTVYYENKIDPEKIYDNLDISRDTVFKIFFYLNSLVTFATIFVGWKRGKELKMTIQNIEKVDELLRKLGISDEHDKMYMSQIYLVAFIITVITILTTIYWIYNHYMCTLVLKIIFVIEYHYPIGIILITDFTFISYTRCLRRKFEQLNDVLRTISGATPLFPQYLKLINAKTGMFKTQADMLGQQMNDDTQIVKVAKQAHLELVKICKHVNKMFGLHVLISMTFASILIIYFFYHFYTVYIYSHDENKNDQIILSFNYLLLYIMKILAVNHICDRTSLEAVKTGSIICELHEPTTGQEFRSEVREFTLQLIQNPLKFTACGFATLDHTFIQTIVGTVTTYLVLLIQLRDMTESK